MTVSDELSDEVDRIRERLTALENKVESEANLRAMMDIDQSTLGMRMDGQNRLLRALAVTQSEHTARLTRLEEGQRRHTEILDRHSEILDRHTEILDRHSEILDSHTVILGRHSEILNSHTEILGRHSQALDTVQAGIRDILTLLQSGGAGNAAG